MYFKNGVCAFSSAVEMKSFKTLTLSRLGEFPPAQTLLSSNLKLGNILFYCISELFAKKIQKKNFATGVTSSQNHVGTTGWGGRIPPPHPLKNQFLISYRFNFYGNELFV